MSNPTRAAAAITERVVRYWTLSGPGDAAVVCELCRTSDGLQVRCGHSVDDADRTETVTDVAAARRLAERWKLDYGDD